MYMVPTLHVNIVHKAKHRVKLNLVNGNLVVKVPTYFNMTLCYDV